MRNQAAALILRLVSFAKHTVLALLGAAVVLPSVADETVYQDQNKLIKAPRSFTRLGDDLFGDKVNLYTGSLEFIQTDVSLPGNSSLPVSIGRRLVVGQEPVYGTLFGRWDLEIPHLHGVFATKTGWVSGNGTSQDRCSKFSAPPKVSGTLGSIWSGTEYWHGSYLYIPGVGDQEMLYRMPWFNLAPNGARPETYPIVTRNKWAIRCLPTMNSVNGEPGEAFIALSPDGTEYQFDWLVKRDLQGLTKSNGFSNELSARVPSSQDNISTPDDEIARWPQPHASDVYMLRRVEVWILPTRITDRHGNTVTYTYDTTNKWQLKSIVGTDVGGSLRTITLGYVTPGSETSNLVNTVSDGTRTWRYTYDTANRLAILQAVTLPDGSAWQLGGLSTLEQKIDYGPGGGGCDDAGNMAAPALIGQISHPSGAQGEFILSATRHGRAAVEKICQDASSVPYYPRTFDTYALTKKTISGPGLQTMEWTTVYSTATPSWAPCDGCTPYKFVEVTDPAKNMTRYAFGTLFRQTEGQLLQTEVHDTDGNLVKATYIQYAEPVRPFGFSEQRRGDGVMAARVTETNRRHTNQQGVDFLWQAEAFDPDFGMPTRVLRGSSLGASRRETTTYDNNLNMWVLGRVATVTEGSGKVMVRNIYNQTTGNLEKISKFDHLEQLMTYHPDGTLASRTDGLNQTTAYENYKRGIPRRVRYADGSQDNADIDDLGLIRSISRQISADGTTATTGFDYDAMGRLSKVIHPEGDSVQWNPTIISFNQVWDQEYDLAPGHWRQIVTTGSAYEVTFLDALWRPVYTERWDAADRSGTNRFVERKYDFAGRMTYESFPKRAFGDGTAGVEQRYDALGRLTVRETSSELGTLYDGLAYTDGFRKQHTDAKGNTSVYTYQAFDEPSEDAISTISLPEGVFVDIRRDLFGKPLSITRSGHGKRATRSYVYDSNERLCKTIEPETGATVQDYDAANNINWRATGLALLSSSSCDTTNVPESKKATFRYDARNRLTTTTYGDGSPGITRTYTPDGLLETIDSNGAVWTNRYNKRRMHLNESLAYGGVYYQIGRVYDANGSLAQLTYPDNTTIVYSPNALGEPRQVGSYATGISYHPNGAIRGFTYGNGIVHTMSQNLRGLPEWSVDAGVLRDNYEYDKNGNVASIADWQEGISNRGLQYDGLDRLKSVNSPPVWGDAWYEYDALDNLVSTRLTAGGTARTTNHTFDPTTNQLTRISNSTGTGYNFDFLYDNQGNIIKRGSQGFTFDLANRMIGANGKATYAYDGLGRRVSIVGTDGVNRINVYSQEGQLLYTTTTSRPLTTGTKYIYLHKHVIAEVQR